jgi:hypothetical protein
VAGLYEASGPSAFLWNKKTLLAQRALDNLPDYVASAMECYADHPTDEDGDVLTESALVAAGILLDGGTVVGASSGGT